MKNLIFNNVGNFPTTVFDSFDVAWTPTQEYDHSLCERTPLDPTLCESVFDIALGEKVNVINFGTGLVKGFFYEGIIAFDKKEMKSKMREYCLVSIVLNEQTSLTVSLAIKDSYKFPFTLNRNPKWGNRWIKD